MKAVGKKLEDLALAERDEVLLDLYGRSAYNRYYYAAFLTVRDMIRKLDGEDKRIKHASISEILEGRIRKKLKSAIEKLERKGFLKKAEAARYRSSVHRATRSLSDVMKLAYDLRAVADYEPEVKVKMNSNVIYLEEYKLSRAQHWYDEANAYCLTLLAIWKEVTPGEF